MFSKAVIASVILSVGILGALGCQEGVKKNQDTLVHQQGVREIDDLQTQLLDFKVDLNDTTPGSVVPTVADFPETLVEGSLQYRLAQGLLEQYVFKAEKILALGDTKVVLFPEKSRVQRSNNRASQLLGRIYAGQKISGSTAVDTRTVAYAEVEVRFKKFSSMLKGFTDAGFTSEVLESGYGKIVNSISDKTAKALIKSTETSADDAYRIVALSKAYNYFDIPYFQRATDSFPALAGMFQQVSRDLQARFK